MDHDETLELDRLLAKTRASALTSLTAIVDIEHQLEIIRRACTVDRDKSTTHAPSAPS
jgi:hypothetical protein